MKTIVPIQILLRDFRGSGARFVPAMSAAAAAGADPVRGDPSRELNTPQDREGWFKLHPARFTGLCSQAYADGNYSYVGVALKANHEAMKEFIEKTTTAGIRSVSGEENYDLLRMTQKIHSLLLSMVNRNMHAESEVKKAIERLRSLEYNVDTAKATFESVNNIAEKENRGHPATPNGSASTRPCSS